MVGLGLRRAPEGWRRTVGILLRSESTRFALSAFGLRVPSDREKSLTDRIAGGLLAFLATESDAHFALDWLPSVTVRQRIPFVDLVVLEFADDGRLVGLQPRLAGSGPAVDASVRDRVLATVVDAYNRTRALPELERPRRLRDEILAQVPAGETPYAMRILAAGCLSFETIDTTDRVARFSPPSFSDRRTLGFGYLSWVARPVPSADAVDLWVSAHHVGLDGVPLQDMLVRLERAWGGADSVVFPPPMDGVAFSGPRACHAPGEREVDQLTTFVDLSPVVALRRAATQRFSGEIGGDVTLGTLVAWLLTQEDAFASLRIASTVDVPASNGYERDVDVVSLRPADYRTGSDPWDGFIPFAREFNRLIAACRARTSPVRVGMQTAGLLPPWVHATMVRAQPASLDDTFGTLCVTIIRDARVFLAPMTDLGLGNGFFAIGSATLPSADGRVVTSVSVKGAAGRVTHYPAILQRMIARATILNSRLAV